MIGGVMLTAGWWANLTRLNSDNEYDRKYKNNNTDIIHKALKHKL